MESPLVLRHSRRGIVLRCGLGLMLALDILRETSEFTSSWRRVPLGDRMGGWDAFLEEEGQQMERRHRFQAPEPEIYEAGGAGVPAYMGSNISHGSAPLH